MESSADSESNLSRENQSEAEDANDSLNVTNDMCENEAENQSKKPLKGKRRQTRLPWEEVKLFRNLQITLGKKAAESKIPEQEKRPQEARSKIISTEENINSDPKARKIATKSSS